MGFLIAVAIIVAILAITYVGVAVAGLTSLFGIVLPYLAIACFIVGIVYRIVNWAKSPVPFNIVPVVKKNLLTLSSKTKSTAHALVLAW